MVTSAPASHSAAAMSWAELFEPITTAFLPGYASGPGCLDEWCCSPLKTSIPLKFGTLGLPDTPVASTRCFGRSVVSTPSRSTTTVHSFALSSYEALLHSVEPQKLSSMTFVYISSQSPILSFGEKTGQLSGKSM